MVYWIFKLTFPVGNANENIHFILVFLTSWQYYNIIEEIEWAIEEARKCGLPVAASMCIGKEGDVTGVSPGDCAVRMARAGADVGQAPFFVPVHFLNYCQDHNPRVIKLSNSKLK